MVVCIATGRAYRGGEAHSLNIPDLGVGNHIWNGVAMHSGDGDNESGTDR